MMHVNRANADRDRYDPAGRFQVPDARRTALLAIEEVLGEATRDVNQRRESVQLPRPIPVPRPYRAPLPRVRRRPRKGRTRGIVGLTLALATCVGLLFGSGVFNAQDRANADLVAAQQGSLEVYTLPEVPGHPGAQPTPQRSTSIREFLGMVSAF